MFDYQPVLKSDLLTLRPLRADDHDELYAVASDPLIWEQHPENRNEPAVFHSFFDKAIASGAALIAVDSATDRVIGTSRYHAYDAEASEVEIGWTFLGREYWGGRYNGEMKRLMLEHAFRFVDHVVFLVAPENVRSWRAVEKIGGVRDGSRRDGEGRMSLLYRVSAR
jgi:RimJ/RimL family protein N-acetyltransferase